MNTRYLPLSWMAGMGGRSTAKRGQSSTPWKSGANATNWPGPAGGSPPPSPPQPAAAAAISKGMATRRGDGHGAGTGMPIALAAAFMWLTSDSASSGSDSLASVAYSCPKSVAKSVLDGMTELQVRARAAAWGPAGRRRPRSAGRSRR